MKCAKCNNWITGLPCKDCGDLTKKAKSLDLNEDGKVDKKDAAIASKVMNKVKKDNSKKGKK